MSETDSTDNPPSKIVTGSIAPIRADKILPGAFATAKAGGVQITVPLDVAGVHQVQLLAVEPHVVVAPASLDYAAGVATRINSRANRKRIADAVAAFDEGTRTAMLSASREMFALADDVIEQGGGQLHSEAIAIALRVTSPDGLAALPHTPEAGEMIALAYAVIHYHAQKG